jgi:asparagine synthase (glutamine-hydrolysing)
VKINTKIKESSGWKRYKIHKYDVWFSGYIFNEDKLATFRRIILFLNNNISEKDDFHEWLKKIRGHFSLIISDDKNLFSMVDRIRSIPIFFNKQKNEVVIGNYAPDVSKHIISEHQVYNKQAALEIAMSGYTIGDKTLDLNLLQLCPGEYIIVKDNVVKVSVYYQYSPWNIRVREKSLLKKELTEVSREILKDVVKNADGRQIVVPLSAGNDSRFIVSGLKELGVKDVFCFSYGIDNNFEVRTAKKISEHLGYEWLHIPLSLTTQRKYFREKKFHDFLEFTDTLSNSQVLIDYSAVKRVKDSRKISKESIFINGNSGDFVTGGHVLDGYGIGSDAESMECLIQFIIKKHYSLWRCLKTTENLNNIKIELNKVINKIMTSNSLSWSSFSEIGEGVEWSGRQSKFITTTQRSYEFHGYDWRLPMWDSIYMDFWEGVEKKYKINQLLYIETLLENNWGGVWSGISVNDFSITSSKIRLLRGFFKLFFTFLGKDAWHIFDKRYFSYFYDDTAATAIVPYSEVMFDKCGARDRNSWIVKKYLHEKNIDIILNK